VEHALFEKGDDLFYEKTLSQKRLEFGYIRLQSELFPKLFNMFQDFRFFQGALPLYRLALFTRKSQHPSIRGSSLLWPLHHHQSLIISQHEVTFLSVHSANTFLDGGKIPGQNYRSGRCLTDLPIVSPLIAQVRTVAPIIRKNDHRPGMARMFSVKSLQGLLAPLIRVVNNNPAHKVFPWCEPLL